MLVIGVVLTLAVVVGGLVVVAGKRDDSSNTAGTTTTSAPTTPEDVFQTATDALSEAGHFTYDFTGRWEVEPFQSGDTEIITEDGNGAVSIEEDVAHHSVTSNDGARTDLVHVDDKTWTRASAFPDQIEQRPWADWDMSVGATTGFDPRAMPEWLDAATNHRDGGEDPDGRTVIHAEVPPRALPPGDLDLGTGDDQTLTGDLALTIDAGAVVRVEVEATTQTAVVKLVFDGIETTTPVVVDPPGQDELDQTPFLNEEDIVMVQGTETLGLAGVPDGWLLVGGTVRPDASDPSCDSVELAYMGLGGEGAPESGPDNFIFLEMSPLACIPDDGLLDDPNFSAGDHDGVIEETSDGNFGAVRVDDTLVGFGTNLSPVDIEVVLATLGPVDLTAEPEAIEGIPSEPT